MTTTKPKPDGLDTALARLLLEQGSLPLGPLRACLEAVREARQTDPQASLALSVVQQGLVPQDVVDAALRRLIPSQEEGATPARIGPYRVERELARGGMGAVYEATHESTGARYAVKTLLPGLLGAADSEELARFRREAQVMGQLDHPHVARVHSADLDGPQPYLVQGLLPGGTLHQRVQGAGMSVEEAVALTVKLARGLEHCHGRGVLHRDLKPENVMFDEHGEPLLVDFGLAKTLEASRRLTASGALMGTAAYMAPEQAMGTPTDARTDVYGLGGVLYFLLSGRPPFEGDQLFEVLARVTHDPPPPLLGAPAWLAAVCLKALEKDPESRYPDMTAFAQALEAGVAPPRAPRRISRRQLFAGAVLVGLAGLVAVALSIRAEPVALPERSVRVSVAPSLPTVVHGQRVTVAFSVEPASAQVRVRVGDGPWRDLPNQPTYRESVALALGPNAIALEARTQDGLRDAVAVQVECLTPDWWAQADEAERVAYPLPAGLAFTLEPGVFVHEKSRVELVHVPAGEFVLGFGSMRDLSTSAENQYPSHRARITRAFFFGRYELTCEEYRRFAAHEGEDLPPGAVGRLPMVLSWHQAQAFCEWAGGLRLPTEAEWEYAAEGGSEGRLYPWGDASPTSRHCNLAVFDDGFDGSAPVGSFPTGVSRWGSHDMGGNLWEWTHDRYRLYPQDPSLVLTDPVVGGEGIRSIRGGAWNSREQRETSVNFRLYVWPGHGADHPERDPRCALRVVAPAE